MSTANPRAITKTMRKTTSGFTIVEILILIVVIAILAVITVVVYNGIQARTENIKTVSAVSAWAKALQLYKVDMGSYPAINSCLGDTSTYTNANGGVCWGASGSATWVVQASFLAAMKGYVGNNPEPSNKNIHTGTNEYRGAMYYIPGGPTTAEIRVNLLGISGLSNCPGISGVNSAYTWGSYVNGSSCYYRLPQ